MTVWVVVGEYDTSRNGEACWVAGVARNKKRGLLIAQEDAELSKDREAILIDGEKWTPSRWQPGDREWDWTLSYSVEEHEVMG